MTIRVKYNRNITIQKQAAVMSQVKQGSGSKIGTSKRADADLKVQDRMNEDDVMLLL